MIMDSGLPHATVLPAEIHGHGGDIDSLLSSGDGGENVPGPNPHGDGKARRLLEPYERHRAHDLRAECYRRGIRPIKKGPNANDNKNGYIVLLRKYDGTNNADGGGGGGAGVNGGNSGSANGHHHPHSPSEEDADDADSDSNQMASLAKKRKLTSQHLSHVPGGGGNSLTNAAAVVAATAAANDLAGFYDTTSQTPLVPVLPMHYPNLTKPPPANPTTTDLEILSGIANSYTMQMAGGPPASATTALSSAVPTAVTATGSQTSDLCGQCRSVVSEQLMESIRLGRNKMQMLEYQRVLDMRDKDAMHLKEIITVLRDLRQSLRDAQKENRLTHELLAEYEDDIAFFQTLKERTKDRMRREMQEARDRASKQLGGVGVVGGPPPSST